MNIQRATATILVVDDNPVLRLHAAEVLLEAGYEVVQAADAAGAMDALSKDQAIQLIFTDVQMPGDVNGITLAEQVQKRRPDMRLLITSGGAKIMDESLPDDSRFLTKPYSDWQVLGHVKAMIEEANSMVA